MAMGAPPTRFERAELRGEDTGLLVAQDGGVPCAGVPNVLTRSTAIRHISYGLFPLCPLSRSRPERRICCRMGPADRRLFARYRQSAVKYGQDTFQRTLAARIRWFRSR